MLASLMPYDQQDLCTLFFGEPWLNKNNHIRFYAGESDLYGIPWTARIMDPDTFVKDLTIKQAWEELKLMQSLEKSLQYFQANL